MFAPRRWRTFKPYAKFVETRALGDPASLPDPDVVWPPPQDRVEDDDLQQLRSALHTCYDIAMQSLLCTRGLMASGLPTLAIIVLFQWCRSRHQKALVTYV
jgi:hypothetical protein